MALLADFTCFFALPSSVWFTCLANRREQRVSGEEVDVGDTFTLVIVWSALGVPLAFKKGEFGAKVAWIGARLTDYSEGIVARAKDDILDGLEFDIKEASAGNYTTKAVLRTMAGRASHVATVFRVWRPFLSEL